MSEQNLYTAAEGIFDTHVTWRDIELDMQDALGTTASFGRAKTIKNIGDGNGFMSKICLIEPDWQGASKDEKLPNKFVAKLCTAVTIAAFSKQLAESKNMDNVFEGDFLKSFETQVRTFHNCEVNVYNLFKKYNVDRVPHAKIYHMHKFSEESPLKGYILMDVFEDLASVHIFDNLKPESLLQPLRALAVMEAVSLKFTDEEKALFTQKPLADIFGTFFGEEIRGRMGQLLRGIGGARLEPLITKFEEYINEMAEPDYYDGICKKLGITPVLCHGDLWSTNVLWRKVEGELKIVSVIDFQTSHFGNPAGDLCRFFNATLSGKDRRDNWENLLEKFHGFLVEEIADGTVPYTLEQLKEAYRTYIPIGGYMIVPMLGPFFEIIFKNPDEDERKKILEIVLEKTESLLEDMIEYHQRNIAAKAK